MEVADRSFTYIVNESACDSGHKAMIGDAADHTDENLSVD